MITSSGSGSGMRHTSYLIVGGGLRGRKGSSRGGGRHGSYSSSGGGPGSSNFDRECWNVLDFKKPNKYVPDSFVSAANAPCIGLCFHNKLMAIAAAGGSKDVNSDELDFSRGWPLNARDFDPPCVGQCFHERKNGLTNPYATRKPTQWIRIATIFTKYMNLPDDSNAGHRYCININISQILILYFEMYHDDLFFIEITDTKCLRLGFSHVWCYHATN